MFLGTCYRSVSFFRYLSSACPDRRTDEPMEAYLAAFQSSSLPDPPYLAGDGGTPLVCNSIAPLTSNSYLPLTYGNEGEDGEAEEVRRQRR
jgi:hypothetical protein